MHLGMKSILSLALWCGVLFADPMYITFPSNVQWITRRSAHFEILYRRGYDELGLRALKNAERAHKILAPLFPPGPERTYIVLADFQDSTNGYSVDIPYPHIVIFAAPPEPSGTLSALDDWLFSVILHEYVHTLHLYPSKGAWSWLRAVFGPVILPLGLLPTHLHEGLATFYETKYTTRGRGRGAEFPMFRRLAVEERKWGNEFVPLDLKDGSASRWPGGTSAYFFGYYLYEELHKRKGTEGIKLLVDDYSGNWPYFVNSPLEKVYGLDYKTLWREIYVKTGTEALKEIQAIKREGLSPLEYLTDTRFNKWDLSPYPQKGTVLVRTASPQEGSFLELFDVAQKKTLKRIGMGANRTEGICAGTRQNRTWVLTLNSSTRYNVTTNLLQAWQPDDNDTQYLGSDGDELATMNHLHLLGCSPDLNNLTAYREMGGDGSVVQFSVLDSGQALAPRVKVSRYWKIPEGARVTGVTAGAAPWFVVRNGPMSHLYFWPSKKKPELVLETRAHLFHLRWNPEDKSLYFIGDFDGRNEIARWEPQARRLEKVVTLLGGTNSFVFEGRDFYATSYRHGGYDVAKVARLGTPRVVATTTKRKEPPKPKITGRVPRKPSAAEETDREIELSVPRRYTAWSTLYPRTWIPSVLFVPDGIQAGFWVPGFDLSQCHYYDIIGGYDMRVGGSQPFGILNYRYRFLEATQALVSVFYNPNYLFLSSGSTFQKVWGGNLGVSSLLPYSNIRWTLSLIAQRTEAFGSFTANQSMGGSLGLNYDFGYSSKPLGVSPKTGTTLSVTHQQFFKGMGSTDNYYRLIAEAKQHLPSPLTDDHTFFLAVRGGFTHGTTLFNSYFQGGGEILFSQARVFFQNRGFPFGTFLSRQLVNGTIEYRFPVWRVDRGWNLQPGFLKNLHGRLVADLTSPRPVGKQFYGSFGVELLSDWTISYYLPAQLRVGAYHGVGPFGEPIRVVMGLEASL